MTQKHVKMRNQTLGLSVHSYPIFLLLLSVRSYPITVERRVNPTTSVSCSLLSSFDPLDSAELKSYSVVGLIR